MHALTLAHMHKTTFMYPRRLLSHSNIPSNATSGSQDKSRTAKNTIPRAVEVSAEQVNGVLFIRVCVSVCVCVCVFVFVCAIYC